MCFHVAAYAMDKENESNKSLSLFECFNQSKEKLSQEFLTHLSASSDAQSAICPHVCYDKQYWYVDKQIEDAQLISFDPTGKYLAAGYKDNRIKVFDAALNKVEHELAAHSQKLKVLKFDPTGRYLATGCADRTVRLFDAVSRKCMWKLNDDLEECSDVSMGVFALEFSPIGDKLAIVCLDEPIIVVEVKSRRLVYRLPGMCDHISFHPKGEYAAIAKHKDVLMIELETKKEVWNKKGEWLSNLLIFDSTGRYLATSDSNSEIRVFEALSGNLLCSLKPDIAICSMSFGPTGEYLVIGNSTGWGAVRIFQIPSGKLVHLIPHNDTVFSVSFDFTGKYLATGCESLSARILTQYHQWTLLQKLLLKMLSTWLCIERPATMQSFDELLHDVSLKFGCDLKELQNTLKTFPEKMVSSIWEKMKYMIKVYGKEQAERIRCMQERNQRMFGSPI